MIVFLEKPVKFGRFCLSFILFQAKIAKKWRIAVFDFPILAPYLTKNCLLN
jgi:hypothetical protein